jgi:hypothetical protein
MCQQNIDRLFLSGAIAAAPRRRRSWLTRFWSLFK